MQKISGIGAFFFRAKDPAKLSKWYEKNFGIDEADSRNIWMQHPGPTVFAPLAHDTNYFGSMHQQFMLNFRVNDMDAMIKQLEDNGVTVGERRDDAGAGKFASVFDPEGNKIELWEPTNESNWKDPSK